MIRRRYYAPNARPLLGCGAYSDAATQTAACEVGKAFGNIDGLQNKTSAPEANPNGYEGNDYVAYKKCYEAAWVQGAAEYHRLTDTTPGSDPATASGLPQCSSAQAIRKAQQTIGAPVDGAWGPTSESALAKAGMSFWQASPCLGSRPQYINGKVVLTYNDSPYDLPQQSTPGRETGTQYAQSLTVTGASIDRALVAIATPLIALFHDVVGWIDWGKLK